VSGSALDLLCQQITTRKPGTMVSWYLMASYLYYQCDVSLLSDEIYDALCDRLKWAFDSIEHPHKRLVDLEGLSAGTGYHIPADQYPSMVKCAAMRLAQEHGLLEI
jgi:hypothetical protein